MTAVLAHSAAQVRAAEEPLLAAGEPLMARAAHALALAVLREVRARAGSWSGAGRPRVSGSRVLVLVGSGSNGGDGLHAAAHLARRGLVVDVLLVGTAVHSEGLAAARRTSARLLDVRSDPEVASAARCLGERCDVVVDALTGIGGTGALRGAAAEVVEALADLVRHRDGSARRPAVVACDVPSGIGVDDGTLPGPVLPADLTVTFGTAKPGLLLPPASGVVGRLEVVDLGLTLPAPTLTRLGGAEVARLLPRPGREAHKYSRGVLGVVAGSDAYPGAAVLATAAAAPLVGMVRFLGPDAVTSAVLARSPEVVRGDGRVQAWLVGSGVDPQDEHRLAQARACLERALEDGLPTVVDAGGLAVLPERVPAHVVLVPHAGELQRLLAARGEEVEAAAIAADPLAAARLAHVLTGATVLLKGATTVVVGDGLVITQDEATPWLATAGAGDVLAGLAGALLAAHGPRVVTEPGLPARLAAAAASLHGRAAVHASGGGPIVAADLLSSTVVVASQLLGQ